MAIPDRTYLSDGQVVYVASIVAALALLGALAGAAVSETHRLLWRTDPFHR